MPASSPDESGDPQSVDASEFCFEPIDPEIQADRVGQRKLPMPQQDRDQLEARLAMMRQSRLSLMEVMVALTMVCVLLGISNFVRFDVYTVGLGLTALAVLLGAFDFAMSQRHRNFLIVILLISYAAASTWIIAKVEGWFS